jgi:hypothetical protein
MPQEKDLKVKIKKIGKEKLNKEMFDLSPNFWGIGAFLGHLFYCIFLTYIFLLKKFMKNTTGSEIIPKENPSYKKANMVSEKIVIKVKLLLKSVLFMSYKAGK